MKKFYYSLFLAAIFIINDSYARVAWVNPENIKDSRFDPKTGYFKASIKTDTSLEFRNFKIPPPRATLKDRRGVVLAYDEYFPRVAIWIEGGDAPKASDRFFKDLKVLGELINREIDMGDIPLKMFEERRGSPIVFNQVLSSAELEKIQKSNRPRIRVLQSTKRNYPFTSSLVHAVGWSTSLNFLSDTFIFHPIKGRSGIESLLDKRLSGKMGTLEVLRDARDYTLKMIFESQGESLDALNLGLDFVLQDKVINAINGSLTKGVVLVADALSGEIPVMLSLPTFNPMSFSPFVKEKFQTEYLSDPSEPMANRIYRNYYGSSWKNLENYLRYKDDFDSLSHQASVDYAQLMNLNSFVPQDRNVTPLFFSVFYSDSLILHL